MRTSLQSIVLVLIQFISIYLLFHLTPWSKYNILSIIFLSLGVFIGLWGVFTMRKSTLKITPEVDNNAKLVTDGPYKFIRHPMYTGVMTACFGTLVAEVTQLKIIIFLVLTVDLLLKLRYEEGMLQKHFKDYETYKTKTYRLLPYIY